MHSYCDNITFVIYICFHYLLLFMILCFSVIKNQVTEKRNNKKNKILLIFALIFTKKSSFGSFQPFKTTKAVKFVSPSSTYNKRRNFVWCCRWYRFVTRQIKEHLSDSTLAEQFTHFTISFLLNKLEMSIYDLQDHSGFEFEFDLFPRTWKSNHLGYPSI